MDKLDPAGRVYGMPMYEKLIESLIDEYAIK